MKAQAFIAVLVLIFVGCGAAITYPETGDGCLSGDCILYHVSTAMTLGEPIAEYCEVHVDIFSPVRVWVYSMVYDDKFVTLTRIDNDPYCAMKTEPIEAPQ